MSQYLLAAEADQIQDLLFRSSQLREVVGGSQLLSRFCDEGARQLLEKYAGNPDQDIIIADGGNFRILFPDRQKAMVFGNDLAELYRLALGSSLTVAEPVTYDRVQFRVANDEAHEKLRQAKREGKGAIASVHLPYMAFCESCGIEIACTRYQREGRTQTNYMCHSCQNKLYERERSPSEFLDSFRAAVRKAATLPEKSRLKLPGEAEDVARLDPRRYVAYLVADGNGMGIWFSKCQSEIQMQSLSKALNQSLRSALAEPCVNLLKQMRLCDEPDFLPVLPLILAGDDCFALIPAPWAIDFAQRFCLAYEEKMTPVIQELGGEKATMAAAVVICKASYPYYHAHQRGEALLKSAKQLVKSLKIQGNLNLSAVSFEVITGNASIQPMETPTESKYQPTLCPYFVSQQPLPKEAEKEAEKSGIRLALLLEQRHRLSQIPAKRLAEVRELYAPAALRLLEGEDGGEPKDWEDRLEAWLLRMGRNPHQQALVQKTLKALGDAKTKPGHWLELDRPALNGGSHAHGLPDLIAVWDYAFDLTKNPTQDY